MRYLFLLVALSHIGIQMQGIETPVLVNYDSDESNSCSEVSPPRGSDRRS